MGLIEMEIEKLLETNPTEWLAYKMVLPNIPETGGDAMDIVKKYTGMAIESATKSLETELKKKDELLFAYESVKAPVNPLLAENKRLREMVVEERLPNFCTGIECGCAGRVEEARKKERIKLHKALEKALKQ